MKERWQRLNDELIGTPAYFDLDCQSRNLLLTLQELAASHLRGRVLDAGAGRLTYRGLLAPRASRYVSADIRAERPGLDVVCDLTRAPFRPGVFDTIFCSQVLEHTPRPLALLGALRECLADDGWLILTVPHIAYLHAEPEDYFRYTKYGLRALLERAGFEVARVEPFGGLLSFLATLASDVMLTCSHRVRPVFAVLFQLNRAFVRVVCAVERGLLKDSLLTSIFAVNYAAVARKRERPGDEAAADLP